MGGIAWQNGNPPGDIVGKIEIVGGSWVSGEECEGEYDEIYSIHIEFGVHVERKWGSVVEVQGFVDESDVNVDEFSRSVEEIGARGTNPVLVMKTIMATRMSWMCPERRRPAVH